MKYLLRIISIFLLVSCVYAENSNFMAQGYYYKAKAKYESGSYNDAITYAQKSIQALGGTNEELQYLLTMSYVHKKEWINAEKELEKYSLVESHSKSISRKRFNEAVETLTSDEKKSLAKAMVDIIESAERDRAYKNSPKFITDDALDKIHHLFSELVFTGKKRDTKYSFQKKRDGIYIYRQSTKLKFYDGTNISEIECPIDISHIKNIYFTYPRAKSNPYKYIDIRFDLVKCGSYDKESWQNSGKKTTGKYNVINEIPLKSSSTQNVQKIEELNKYIRIYNGIK